MIPFSPRIFKNKQAAPAVPMNRLHSFLVRVLTNTL